MSINRFNIYWTSLYCSKINFLFNDTKVFVVNWLKWHYQLQHLFCAALYNERKYKKCSIEKAPICLALEEAKVRAGTKILMEVKPRLKRVSNICRSAQNFGANFVKNKWMNSTNRCLLRHLYIKQTDWVGALANPFAGMECRKTFLFYLFSFLSGKKKKKLSE